VKKDDNITFMTKMMTVSCAGALIHPFVFTALEYYSKVILSKKDLNDDLVNPETWKLCAHEVMEKLNKHLQRTPSRPDHCPSCGVAPGEKHYSRCNITICPECGRNLYQCGCEFSFEEFKRLPPVLWTGQTPTNAACSEFGLYGRWRDGEFEPCSQNEIGAQEDIERLYRECFWDKTRQRWVMPEIANKPAE
jgi:hypothetical protein